MSSATPGGAAKQTVLLVGDGAGAKDLKDKLTSAGYDVVGSASTAAAAAKLFKSKEPQVLVLNLSAEQLETARSLSPLMETRRCPMIAVCASALQDCVDAACAAGACGFLIGPVTSEALSAQIQVSAARFNALEQVIREKAQIAQDLETRKFVDRAKAILIKRAGLTEPEAHRRLQQESQKRRMSMGEVARRIVEADELLGQE
jgi:response regulator NasT